MPKPPPTSGVMTQIRAGSDWNTVPIRFLINQPPCVLAYKMPNGPWLRRNLQSRRETLHRRDDQVVHDGQPRDVCSDLNERIGRCLVSD